MSGNDLDFDDERRREADRWLAVATADIRAVRLCLDADEPMLGIAAYHCQQAAEKVVKGMLVIAGIPFAKTHDMTRLGDLAASRYAEFQPLLAEVGRLTVWGYAYRYPSLEDALEPEPPTEAFVAALQTIHRLADNLRSLIADNKKSE
jgi:HEPN domain-containing protein